MVPRSGNLVQGQSELPINPLLAEAATRRIAQSDNHYSPAEGVIELRRAVAKKISIFNGIQIDPEATPLQLLITSGATGALVAIAQTYLKGYTTLVFEPYYPYHRYILDEFGAKTETLPLRGPELQLDRDELYRRCQELKALKNFPLRAIIACSPANPTGRVFTQSELEAIANICRELDLLCIADEVYEHYVIGTVPHLSIASFPEMWERTITVNSFSKSWNISGWRLGYCFGDGGLIAPLNRVSNVFYVCTATPLQKALSEVLMIDPAYYDRLRENFKAKQQFATQALTEVGFDVYDSGSAFYLWARIPEGYRDATELNQMLIEKAQVAAVPGSAFTDGDDWDSYLRVCIAREDEVLHGAIERIQSTVSAQRAAVT